MKKWFFALLLKLIKPNLYRYSRFQKYPLGTRYIDDAGMMWHYVKKES